LNSFWYKSTGLFKKVESVNIANLPRSATTQRLRTSDTSSNLLYPQRAGTSG